MTPPTLVRVVRIDRQRGGEKTKAQDPRILGSCPKTVSGNRDHNQAKRSGGWVGKKEIKEKERLLRRCVS
jgi:hypothetical protein